VAAAAERGVEVWLRGGWAMDFFLGEVTRDHRDIDWFAWTGDADVLGAELGRRGFRAVRAGRRTPRTSPGCEPPCERRAPDPPTRVRFVGRRWR
jgi:hypothetical protein